MIWQFWAVVWAWLASIPALIVGGMFVAAPVGNLMIGLGIVDLVAFVCAALWFAGKLNTDV